MDRSPASVDVAETLTQVTSKIAAKAATLLGYPESQAFEYGPLLPLLRYNIDNLGDPFSELLYGPNSTELERQVLAWFAHLYDLSVADSWGYVTGSGSEGNLYGLYLGREACPDAILYYSAATHYSVPKAARLLRLPTQVVPATNTGEIDYEAFEQALSANRLRPAIVNATVGTTMTGAIDNITRIVDILRRVGPRDFYIHVDAALAGMLLPIS